MSGIIDCRPAGRRVWLKRGVITASLSMATLIALALVGEATTPPTGWKPSVTQPGGPPKTSASATDASATNLPNRDARPDGGLDYLSLKAEAEEKLRGVLTDDHGVRYHDVHTKLSTLDGGGIVAFCGEENSRTALGGYGGFQRFIASRSVATTEGQMEPSEFAQAWSQFCENAVEAPQVWF